MAQWIDGNGFDVVGQAGFLTEHVANGRAWFTLDERPAHTNMSREPRLHGWCGETNNVSLFARGMARVVRVAKNGRVQVRAISGSELETELDRAGFPDIG